MGSGKGLNWVTISLLLGLIFFLAVVIYVQH
jgi:hypothetical protein